MGVLNSANVFHVKNADGIETATTVAVTGANTYKSEPTAPGARGCIGWCFEIVGGGSGATGTLTVEFTNSTELEVQRGVAKWDTYTAFTTAIPAVSVGAAATQKIPIELVDLTFRLYRLSYANATNGGTVSATAKGS